LPPFPGAQLVSLSMDIPIDWGWLSGCGDLRCTLELIWGTFLVDICSNRAIPPPPAGEFEKIPAIVSKFQDEGLHIKKNPLTW